MSSGLANRSLANRYSLECEIRAEGVGTVYSAIDRHLSSKTVLAKVLDVTLAGDEESRRFERGGVVLKALRRQPGLPHLIDVGTEASLKYLIFENMDGETLAERLRRQRSLPVRYAIALGTHLAAILEKLHAYGLMHGDVRPAHIFLENDPKGIRLLSFDRTLPTAWDQLERAGLSDVRGPSPSEALYWPPARLKRPSDARYDLYALAAVIYEMVSGRRLDAPAQQDAAPGVVDLVQADSLIDPRLKEFLVHALNPEISQQFQSAREMSGSLRELLRTGTLALAEGPKPKVKPVPQHRSNLNPNDVQLVRIYPSLRGGGILEETVPSDAEFEIVVEAKAGAAIHGIGARYFIQLVVRDLTDFTVVCERSLEGYLGHRPWVEPVLTHALPIPAQGSDQENHIYEVLASLHVGIRNPNVSFVKSPMFIITRP